MAIANGREIQAEDLLQQIPNSIRIVIPAICYIEAISTWEKSKYYFQQFSQELDKQINNSERDTTSNNAKKFLENLQELKVLNGSLLNDVQGRLADAIDILLTRTELIQLEQQIIQDVAQTTIIQPETLLIQNDIMDNLILRSIIEHASSHTQATKVFLSANANDFGKQEVKAALRDAGISKYFTRTQDFLGWLQSQNI
ncbi:PIN domain-containing protein [Nostoc sp. FACHB-110]|uniref:PIN domain-containing protein n=1 Tax=Nostoc sp. FACHB-110 TaxID=2692834 RepID=UPI0018EF53EE|nr:PIN domain-containing protein [Nostoc sp. FACHB-110]